MRVLVTAFEPFGGRDSNVSMEALKLLPHAAGEVELNTMLLPVERRRCAQRALTAIERTKPYAVIMLGEAGVRREITVERVAVNLDDFRIEDNAGNKPVDEPIVAGGPDALFSTLPTRMIADGIAELGIPCSLSYTAGTFVCNHLMYSLLFEALGQNRPTGFIHLPVEGVSAADASRAVMRAVEIAVDERMDNDFGEVLRRG